LLVGEFSVNGGKGVGLALDIGLILAVQIDLEDTLSVGLDPSSFTDNFSGIADIIKNGVLDLGEGTRSRTWSLGLLVAVVRLSQNGALGNNEDMLSGEFFFELSDQPGVNLLEGHEQFVGDVEDDGLLSITDIDLLSGGDVKVSQRCLEFGGGHFQIQEFLRHLGFELVGFLNKQASNQENSKKAVGKIRCDLRNDVSMPR
jgi:hypothetical protein